MSDLEQRLARTLAVVLADHREQQYTGRILVEISMNQGGVTDTRISEVRKLVSK